MSTLRNTIILGACYTSSTTAFTPPTSQTYNTAIPLSSTALYRNSPGFIGFSGDDNPNRGGGGGQVGLGGSPNSRRSMDDPFAPSPRMQNGPPTRGSGPPKPARRGCSGAIQRASCTLSLNVSKYTCT